MVAYRTFYRLPARWKRRIVRTFQPTYTIGAVILVRDPEATGSCCCGSRPAPAGRCRRG